MYDVLTIVVNSLAEFGYCVVGPLVQRYTALRRGADMVLFRVGVVIAHRVRLAKDSIGTDCLSRLPSFGSVALVAVDQLLDLIRLTEELFNHIKSAVDARV